MHRKLSSCSMPALIKCYYRSLICALENQLGRNIMYPLTKQSGNAGMYMDTLVAKHRFFLCVDSKYCGQLLW